MNVSKREYEAVIDRVYSQQQSGSCDVVLVFNL
jgi:hypothetical protein